MSGRGSALGRVPLSSQYPLYNFLLLTNALLLSSERDCSRVTGFPEYAPLQPLNPGSPAPPCGHLSPCSQVTSLDCPSGGASVSSNLNTVEG